MSVAQPVQARAAPSRPASDSSRAGLLLQRKCACEGSAGLMGKCAQCNKDKLLGNSGSRLQKKLSVGASDDPMEREADRVADQVLAGPVGSAVSGAVPRVQRFAEHAAGEAEAAPASVDGVLSSPGRPLESGLRFDMEQRFGHDFSRVRVHSSTAAEQSARDLNASAYTVGRDIVFGEGRFTPGTREGRRLIAHELTHVVQQDSGPGARASSAGSKVIRRSLDTYIKAMQQKPEPDWKTAAEHLNGASPKDIRIILKKLSPHYRAKLHEAARVWPGLCSNVGRFTEADYIEEHPETVGRAADTCAKKPEPIAAPSADAGPTKGADSRPDAGAARGETQPVSPELTEEDRKSCSPLYLQKLCVYIRGGFNGDRSGVETPAEMEGYSKACSNEESGYIGPVVTLSDDERAALRSPPCARGDMRSARARAHDARVSEALRRSAKYGHLSDELVRILEDPVFQISMAVAITGYLALWVVPEPLISKLAAALTTIAILSTGAFTISTIYNLGQAWMDLDLEAGEAQSDEQLERAAERFGKRITAVEANLLVFLASILVAKALPGPKGLPPPAKAIADAERALANAKPGGVVVEGPWGRARAVPPGGSVPAPESPGSFTRGATALKIERSPAPMLEPNAVPEPLRAPPANDVVPRPAPDTANAPSNATPPKPIIPLLPGSGPDPSEATRERQHPEAYPLLWPALFGPPMLFGAPITLFLKGPNQERDQDYAWEVRRELWARHRGSDPDLMPRDWHAHHIVPLFLGGLEGARGNVTFLLGSTHLKGHGQLASQPQMETPPPPLAPLPRNILGHPVGTPYELIGFK